MPQPALSVCIVNWNTRQDLEEALRSVTESIPGLDLEVIVLDNASQDGSADMVRRQFPQVALIENRENAGFARGYNAAARRSTGRYLLVLNPDTIVHRGALGRLVEFMDAHPEAGAVGPRLLNSDGTLQFSCRRFPRPAAAMLRNTFLGRLVPGNRFTRDYLMQDWDHSSQRQVDWVSGAAICIRREAWEQTGGFDEGYFMYAEDMDWCLRAEQAGWRVYYLPDAVITHRIGRSSDQRPLAMVIQFHRSAARFYWKHYAPHWPWGLRLLPPAGIWARAAMVMAQMLLLRLRDAAQSMRGKGP
ncbi:MAG: glycosyltransferase family 2 protein [Armatimonadota bacterium]